MSTYTIEVDDDAITKQVEQIINTALNREMDKIPYSHIGEVISETTREIIYSRKDEIVEKVVERATKEIVRKGLPKLIERME